MNCKELRIHLNKLRITKRKLSLLLNHHPSFLSSIVSRTEETDEAPNHVSLIVHLIMSLDANGIDYVKVLEEAQKSNNNNNEKHEV